MEHQTFYVTNVCIVHAVISYAQQTNQDVYIHSGTGYVTDALLTPPNSEEQWRYQGYGRIDNIMGHVQPSDPIPMGFIRVEIAGLDPPMAYARAVCLIAHNTVLLEVSVVRRPPPPPPIVIGRRRTQAFRP